MNILSEKEKALAKNIAYNQKEDYEMVEVIILDFKRMTIEESDYLKKLTNIVLDKKASCEMEKKKMEWHEIRHCEIEAIDLLAGDNPFFAHKYKNLVSNKDFVLYENESYDDDVDDTSYENESYDDDEISYSRYRA